MRGKPSRVLAVAACALLPCMALAAPAQTDNGAAATHPAPRPPARTNGIAPKAKLAGEKPRMMAPSNQRDPFQSLIGTGVGESDRVKNLPPGKAGLEVGTMKLQGVIHGPDGMVAVVENPQLQVYFLHPGDQLYDGRVEQIGLAGMAVRQTSRDAFGKKFERTVTKQVYSAAGAGQ